MDIKDLSGSRGIERAFASGQLNLINGLLLDIGPGRKPKLSIEALALGHNVVAVDLELVSKEWMVRTLKGDRRFEWGWVKEQLPEGEGFLLDIGPAPNDPKPARIAADRGWLVTGVGLEKIRKKLPTQRFQFIHGDFNEVGVGGPFDWILNISSIEHFGLAGRYAIARDEEDADLRGMEKALRLLKPDGKMILTIPVGTDAIMSPKHRVYGPVRFPLLLRGYRIIEQRYYAKLRDDDEYELCDRHTAFAQVPTVNPSYYALALLVLERADV